MSAQTIFISLINAGMTPAGAAGAMGNADAESALRANNAQDGMTSLSDEAYTAAVDNGTYARFTSDGIGYGLFQWTYWSRKKALLNFAKANGVSVGNEAMQIKFFAHELKSEYPALWTFLCATNDVDAATSRICLEYERPAVANTAYRAKKAWDYYEQLSGMTVVEPEPVEEVKAKWTADMPPMATLCEGFGGGQVMVLQKLLAAAGYTVEIGGLFDADTAAVVKQYQSNNGLAADGIVGNQTWTALFAG